MQPSASAFGFSYSLLFFFGKKALCSGTAFWHFFIMLLAAADRKPETPCQKGQKKTRNTWSRKLIHGFHLHQNKTNMIHQSLLTMSQNIEGLIYS